MECCANEPKKKSQVNEKMDSLDRAITDYGENLDKLTQKLGAITRNEPEAPSDCCEKESLVPLAERIDSHASRVRNLNFAMQTLMQLIEL